MTHFLRPLSILGCAALFAPLVVQKPVVTREIPILLLSVLVTLALGLDHWLDGAPNLYSRSDGNGSTTPPWNSNCVMTWYFKTAPNLTPMTLSTH